MKNPFPFLREISMLRRKLFIRSNNKLFILYYKIVGRIFIISLCNFNLRDNATDKDSVRGPRGFSEAMLKEENEESCVEDVESVISSMGIGRGKIIQERDRLRVIGLGRGKPLNTD